MYARIFAAAFLAAVAGCGQPACHVVGTVTHDGQPMTAATIAFEPDGMHGPAAMVPVKAGRFEVPADKQLVAGKYTVRISPGAWIGGEPQPENFPAYTTSADLKAGDSELTFDVPMPKK